MSFEISLFEGHIYISTRDDDIIMIMILNEET